MDRTPTRRGIIAALLAAGTGAGVASPADEILDGVAPVSGGAYTNERTVSGTVESPYGSAAVTYDDHHRPSISAESQEAAYFAVGYVHAADRLFEIDMFRRTAQGRLAEVLGPFAVERDVRHTKLDFRTAAAATRRRLSGTEIERVLTAYADGITAYIEAEPPGVEFGLFDYEPDPWSVLDTLSITKWVSWRFGGGTSLRHRLYRQRFDADTYETLFPTHFPGRPPAIRSESTSTDTDPTSDGSVFGSVDTDEAGGGSRARSETPLDPAFVEWATGSDPPTYLGSNGWVVSGEFTESGRAAVCSDPHVGLQAPPFWYEQRVETPDNTVEGVALPGVPIVEIGRNDTGAWGLTALQGDVTDLYTYEVSDDGNRYEHRGEWKPFETEERRVPVRGGDNRTVTMKKTVHGPVLDRTIDGTTRQIGIAWPGFSDSDQVVTGFFRLQRADSVEEARAACAEIGIPLNVFYGNDDGDTLYQVVGDIPIRREDGNVVAGDRLFDGSVGEGEWSEYEPYGSLGAETTVPFTELPSVTNADYVVSANQRPTDDPAYPIGGRGFAPGVRATRIYELLDEATADGGTVDISTLKSIQLDTVDLLAQELVPVILDTREQLDTRLDSWLDALEKWDYTMTRDSTAALVFSVFLEEFRKETFADIFESVRLEEYHWPASWVLLTLDPDSELFGGDRAAVVAEAMRQAIGRIEEQDWSTYGDRTEITIDHIARVVSGLDYPSQRVDGSSYTVNVNYGSGWGVGYRMITEGSDGPFHTVLPGGNDGSPLAEAYADQLSLWADDAYRTPEAPDGDPTITFEEVDG
jgi:penicillin amidase